MKNKILFTALLVVLFAGCKKEEPEAEPVAKFSYSVNDKTVTFTNQSLNAKSFYWTFGDGSATSEMSPVKKYSSAGTYTVTLKATNITKSSTYEVTISLSDPTPQAKFSYSTNGLEVTFKNQSTNAQSYSWNFGNGKTSTQKDPTITYTSAGTYSVSLVASNGEKTDTYKQNVSVSYKQPTASFSFKTEAPLKIVLTNTSTNATSYEWDFGDGKTSTEKNPTHRYSAVGSYIITLVAKNPSGSQQYRQTVQITAPKVFVKGLRYESVGKKGKYYKSVCKDDDFFSGTWWNTNYTPMLTDNNLPYEYIFSSPIEMTGLSGDNYYTVYVYWNNTSSGDGTQILKQKLYTESIKLYLDELVLQNDNWDTTVSILFEYK
ncbi:MAG: PKD domain-containing protein [Paludibacteraceae bacterium]|nr:PKD domain-containing protein [Paludibacteraceae bacterium]